jgi:hypothetical protein
LCPAHRRVPPDATGQVFHACGRRLTAPGLPAEKLSSLPQNTKSPTDNRHPCCDAAGERGRLRCTRLQL